MQMAGMSVEAAQRSRAHRMQRRFVTAWSLLGLTGLGETESNWAWNKGIAAGFAEPASRLRDSDRVTVQSANPNKTTYCYFPHLVYSSYSNGGS